MSNSHQNSEGLSTEVLSYSDESLAVLENSKFEVNINVSNYADESYISGYINNIFDNLNLILDNFKNLINAAKEYIDNNLTTIPDSIKPPELLDFNFSITGEVGGLVQESLAYVNLNDVNSHLNLRSGAGMGSSIIGSLNNNTKLTIIEGGSKDPNWVQVKTADGMLGFVAASYVATNLSSQISNDVLTNSSSKIGVVNTIESNLNLRTSPGKGNNIITSIPKGSKIEILEYNSNSSWVKVKIGDKVGYVFKDYIKVENEA